MRIKQPYERPSIVRQVEGLMNRMGRPAPAQPYDEIDGVRVEELVEKYGSPLYVFSERTLRRRIREAHQAFSVRYPRVQFAWSYKTNYLDAICLVHHEEGSIAEVVSGMEYMKARKLGVPGNRIIFNGPHKTEDALKLAVKEGAWINMDNFEEIAAVEAAAEAENRTPEVGLRINLDASIYPQWDRFGFNLESGLAHQAVKRIVAGGRLKLTGLHCHIGTFILDATAYGRAVAKLLAFAAAIESEFRLSIRTLNLGGGFASSNTLHASYLPGEHVSPSLAQYADAITGPLLGAVSGREPIQLVLETGRSLIDEAGSLIATVCASKRLSSGRRSLVIDAGVNNLITAWWYRLQVFPAQPFEGIAEETTVYGPLCMAIDCVRDGITLPDLKKGDRVVIRPVGAYTVTQSMQFIELRPAIVMIGLNGEVDVIRRAESLEDLCRNEIIPDRLKPPKGVVEPERKVVDMRRARA